MMKLMKKSGIILFLALLILGCNSETPQEKQLRKAREIREKYGLKQSPDSITVQTVIHNDPCDSISKAFEKLLREKPDTVIIPAPSVVIPEVKTTKVKNPNKQKRVESKPAPKAKIKGKVFATHVVRKGETLYSIAKLYGLSPSTIMKVNKMKSSKLIVGQRLKIEI